LLIRHASPEDDAAACATIYAPFVSDTAISFEERPPTAAEFAQRIERISLTHPWLVAEDGGRVAGYAYGSSHRERASYRWAADVAVYVAEGHRRRGIARSLYQMLFRLLSAQNLRMA
jgi:L-amino acid N-acyltransferase YncA